MVAMSYCIIIFKKQRIYFNIKFPLYSFIKAKKTPKNKLTFFSLSKGKESYEEEILKKRDTCTQPASCGMEESDMEVYRCDHFK